MGGRVCVFIGGDMIYLACRHHLKCHALLARADEVIE